ncbi:MAG: DUF378 domain-containing protein [archaeon]|jgi:uncharacterized membrane protein YuzA (DUF378 family)
MAKDMLNTAAKILLVIGGLNWGLTALGYNVVKMIFGTIPMLEQAIYLLVGIAALVEIYEMVKKK